LGRGAWSFKLKAVVEDDFLLFSVGGSVRALWREERRLQRALLCRGDLVGGAAAERVPRVIAVG
jgi:hypothetical protein